MQVINRVFRIATAFKKSFLSLVSKYLRYEHAIKRGVYQAGVGTYGVPNIYFWDYSTRVRVGKFCSIADGVLIIAGGEHTKDWITTFPFSHIYPKEGNSTPWPSGHSATKGDIEIGSDVWIGTGAIILSGVRIGNGAIIGAGAVVRKNVPNFGIAVGNPAETIGFRFSEEVRHKLEAISWWDLDLEWLLPNASLLLQEPTMAALQMIDDLVSQSIKSEKT